MVEREGFAVAQLVSAMEAGHLPPAPLWSDVRTFDGRPWRGLVDGLIGGIPCQPHSLAGRKRGQLDGRDLWSDARRIVATARPWFVLIENVSGMLSAGDDEVAGAERVWRDLRKLGYAVEGGLFTAAEVGASHERERVFILAVADPNGRHAAGRPLIGSTSAGGRPHDEPARSGDGLQGVGLADAIGERGCSRNGQRQDATDADAPGEGTIGLVVDHKSERRGEGGAEPELRRGRDTAAEPDGTLVHAERPQRRENIGRGHKLNGDDRGRDKEASRPGEPSALFPPAPYDLDGWHRTLERSPELEPAFRRMADGLASRMDIARVDRLRLLGNGVVSLEGAYAIRTLATRLAKRGAPGADELIRLMV